MNPKNLACAAIIAAGCGLFTPAAGRADDSAASIATGGLVARRETRIVMAKEVLEISSVKIAVDYDFRNDTDDDVTTEVAFPVPPYRSGFPSRDVSEQAFQSFRLWADGKPVKYACEVKATFKGQDVTQILRENDIDIPTFAHFDDNPDPSLNLNAVTRDFDRLPQQRRDEFIRAGFFENQGGQVIPEWTVHLEYHWTQTFPAHSTIHIRHEYTPTVGFQMIDSEIIADAVQGKNPASRHEFAGDERENLRLLLGFCPESSFLREVMTQFKTMDKQAARYAYSQWVDFILTSANTWRQPIEDFTLIIDGGAPDGGMSARLISFCSPQNAPVTQLSPDTFQVHLTNFVPQAELRIGFFDFP